jgi:catechol 2,3-dioxygenase-like lactoylglutathione lyase family enzyme
MTVTGIDKKVLVQVCIIVADVEKTTRAYADFFELPMPEFQTTLLNDHTHATYFGNPTDARAKLVCFEIGQIQFELLQPLDPPSSWKDHLDQHGEGIHHIAFFVPNTDVVANSFAEHGYVVTQQGLFTGQHGMYTYLDTDKDMGVVIELLEHYGGSPVLQGPPYDPSKGIGTDIVVQVGIIVKDIAQTAQRWMEVLGLPEPRAFVTPGYAQVETTYHGQPSEATAKLAFFDFGQIQIELIEPDEKPSTWRDFLNEKGEGAHHIAFQVKNTQQAVERFAQSGMPVIQQGLYSDRSGMYTYLNTQAVLATTIELLETFAR